MTIRLSTCRRPALLERWLAQFWNEARVYARLCRSGERCTVRFHSFLTATTSLGVLQPWPLPSSRLVFPRNQAAMITAPRSAAPVALLRRVRRTRNAGAQTNQAAGHPIIWGGPLGVRHDARGPREGE